MSHTIVPLLPAMSDEQIKDIIRQRRTDGLSCKPAILREVIGRGGTERLFRLVREVRREQLLATDGPTDFAEAVGHDEALPLELRKRVEALTRELIACIARARIEERATGQEMTCRSQEEAARRLSALTELESVGAEDTREVAQTLDALSQRVDELERTVAAEESRANEALRMLAAAEDRVANAELELARATAESMALRAERKGLSAALATLNKSLVTLFAAQPSAPPSVRRNGRRRSAKPPREG